MDERVIQERKTMLSLSNYLAKVEMYLTEISTQPDFVHLNFHFLQRRAAELARDAVALHSQLHSILLGDSPESLARSHTFAERSGTLVFDGSLRQALINAALVAERIGKRKSVVSRATNAILRYWPSLQKKSPLFPDLNVMTISDFLLLVEQPVVRELLLNVVCGLGEQSLDIALDALMAYQSFLSKQSGGDVSEDTSREDV